MPTPMRIRIPPDLYPYTKDYFEEKGYRIVSVRHKKDDLIVVAKKISSLFFVKEAADMATFFKTYFGN